MRRHVTIVLIGLLTILAGVLATPANAATADGPQPVEVAQTEPSIQAWSCPSGDFCVWDQAGGVGNRCNWFNADPDWRSGSVVCSWSGSRPVLSALDNGNDSSYLSVQVFRGANYTTSFACLRRGVTYNITNGGVFLRSHKWVRYTC